MEADDLEIAGMHLHDHAGLLGDSVLIITETGFIGSADFDRPDAAFFHDIGNAEALADLHSVGPRELLPRRP